MRPKPLFALLILCLLAASCSGSPEEGSSAATVNAKRTIRADLGPTAVFQTAVSARLTEDAPPPSNTPSATPPSSPTATLTNTPEPTATPEASATPEDEPLSENPWILQAECETNELCSRIEVTNKTPGWLQITLEETNSGEAGFFSVRSQGFATIRMSKGEYWATMTWYCNGEAYSRGRGLAQNLSYEITAKCPSSITIHVLP